MTYTFKLARRLASNHRNWLALALFLPLLGCGSASNLVLTEAPGALTLTIDGLANGAQPQVELSGPDGYQKTVTYSGTISGLPLGTYQVRALPTTAQSTTWSPTVGTQSITLTDGSPTASALVHYTLTTGALDLRIEGLPTSTTAAAHLDGPAGFSLDVASTATLRGLAPGSYTISAGERVIGSATYMPAVPVTTVTVVASLTPAVATVSFSREVAALEVTMTGLPTGAQGRFTLAGPGNYSAALTGAMQLETLDPGSYVATAMPVVWQGHTWSPVNETTPITVQAGTTHLEIVYQLSTGALAVDVEGLPAGVAGEFTVTGPSGFRQTGDGSQEWVGLWPGTYTTTAVAVVKDGKRYTPTKGSKNTDITPGLTPKHTKVTYSQGTGSIALTINGLPTGVAGRVIVIGANSVDTLDATGTLAGLSDGSYTIVANPVGTGATAVAPDPASQVVSVTADAITPAVVNYVATTGSLQVTITGLPQGSSSAVTVTGPGGYSRQVMASTLLTGLAPGGYTVSAAAVTVGGNDYTPSPTSQAPSVTAGSTASVSIAYTAAAPTTGALTLNVAGLPAGTAAAVTVTGPGGFSRAVTVTSTLDSLAPGTYTITAEVVSIAGTTYTVSPTTQTAPVTAGTTVARSVTYAAQAPTTGSLGVAVSGLPSAVAGAVTVTGPGGYSQAVTGTTTLSNLAPGTYTIQANSVVGGGATYLPTPTSQTASVTAGTTTNRSVGYSTAVSAATITVDTTMRYQVMNGWEGVTQIGQARAGFSGWQDAVLDSLVDLGINRVRLEIRSGAENPIDYYTQLRTGVITESEWRPHRYAPVNDNDDPNTISPTGFQFSELDESIEAIVVPMRARLASRGERLYVNLNYVGANTLHANNPAEYAEFMLATFNHIRSRYGFTPDAIEIILEPDQNSIWTGTAIGNAIAATGARLASAGYHPDFIAPSVMVASRAVTYFDQAWAVTAARPYITDLSYHRYSGVSDDVLRSIGSRAAQRAVRTGMLEHIGSGVEDLYDDLTMAQVSGWQQFALAYPGTTDDGGVYYMVQGTTPVMGSRTKLLWQYFHYVRLGAQRVQATSISGSVRPVAFLNPGGGMAVVVHIDAAGSYSVAGLRPGTYTVTFTNAAGTRVTLPSVTASAGGQVTVSPNQTGILTLSRVP